MKAINKFASLFLRMLKYSVAFTNKNKKKLLKKDWTIAFIIQGTFSLNKEAKEHLSKLFEIERKH